MSMCPLRAFSLSVLVCLVCGFVAGCADVSPEKSSSAGGEVSAELAGVRLRTYRGGEPVWTLDSDRGVYRAAPGVVDLAPVSMEITTRKGNPVYLRAPRGVVTVSDRQVQLPDGVEGRDEEGMTFWARRATFSNRSSHLRGDGGVTYADRLIRLSGGSFLYDLERRRLSLSGGVEAVVRPEGGGT